MAWRKPSRPQIILLFFQGLFIISARLHTIPLLLDILPTVISVLACTFFFFFLAFFSPPPPPFPSPPPRSGSRSRQFHARPVLGVSPRALETIRRLFPLSPHPKKIPGLLHYQPFTSVSVTIKQLDGNYFQTRLSFPISRFTVRDYSSKRSAVRVGILRPAAIFHMGNREVILTLNIWSALFRDTLADSQRFTCLNE